ncbi:uncharacterized protein [Battus philenor]|uniref:uncharacterized protein n=1 Tax=Battus philenor TaxID=42288 RepID=UPI0035CECEF0
MVRWSVMIALCAIILVVTGSSETSSRFQPKKRSRNADLQPGQQAEVDAMVNNLLQWIQGFYQQKNRKARQYFGGKPERPRPFEPPTYLPPGGYPPSGPRPTPIYNEGPSASPGYQPSSPTPNQYSPNQSDQSPFQPNQPPYIPSRPFQSSFQPNQPTQTSYQPSLPSQSPFTSSQPLQPSSPLYQPSSPSFQSPETSFPSSPASGPSYQTNQPTQPSYQPSSQPTYQPSPSYQPIKQTSSPYQPSQPTTSDETTYLPLETSQQPEQSQTDTTKPDDIEQATTPSTPDDDDRHPPHIHAITVDCGKEMMTINIEFNKVYNGIIYSKDHYSDDECVYVRENSNQIKYSFTVSLNTCGTRFFSDFENEGQAYLENVLVLQNEAGIQEVWDHIRRVRCLWEGNLTKQLISSLSVGMLNQITSNFSGDTAMARLDIQTGKGPFAPEANGLIKIGETMTLVVSVTGDTGFDIFVRECVARDSGNRHVVPLTDSNGCVLKPKLFGSFQKTRDTGNTGASILAYAYFNAFKFPDEMDLIIQCEVELCKTDCESCPNPGSAEPKRRRRDVIHVGNKTVDPITTIGKSLRVVFAEDLPIDYSAFCISSMAAMWGGVLVLVGSLMTSLAVTFCWQRSRGSMKFS